MLREMRDAQFVVSVGWSLLSEVVFGGALWIPASGGTDHQLGPTVVWLPFAISQSCRSQSRMKDGGVRLLALRRTLPPDEC